MNCTLLFHFLFNGNVSLLKKRDEFRVQCGLCMLLTVVHLRYCKIKVIFPSLNQPVQTFRCGDTRRFMPDNCSYLFYSAPSKWPVKSFQTVRMSRLLFFYFVKYVTTIVDCNAVL